MTNRPPLPILIVDDSALVRQALKAIVEADPGFRVLLASDPYEAVEVMKRTVPAAILLDVNMPRMDGLTFLRKLMRQHPLPVLLCTDHPQKALEGLEIGALEVIPKPRWEEPSERDAWGERLRESLHLAIAAAAKGKGSATDLIEPIPRLTVPAPPECRRRPPAAEAAAPGTAAGSRPDHRYRGQHRGRSGHHPAARGLPQGRTRDRGRPAYAGRVHHGAGRAARPRPDDPPGGRRGPSRRARPRGRALIVPGRRPPRRGPAGRPHLPRRPGRRASRQPVPTERRRPVPLDGAGRRRPRRRRDPHRHARRRVRGLLEMSEAGSWTIAQDRATSTVFGMNAEAIRLGAARQVLPLDRIAEAALRS